MIANHLFRLLVPYKLYCNAKVRSNSKWCLNKSTKWANTIWIACKKTYGPGPYLSDVCLVRLTRRRRRRRWHAIAINIIIPTPVFLETYSYDEYRVKIPQVPHCKHTQRLCRLGWIYIHKQRLLIIIKEKYWIIDEMKCTTESHTHFLSSIILFK